jgi:hypothetical protein
MVHKKIRIPRESANEIMRALGNLKASVEFEDLTKDDIEAKKSFGDMIKRCEDIKKKFMTIHVYVMTFIYLSYIIKHMKNFI